MKINIPSRHWLRLGWITLGILFAGGLLYLMNILGLPIPCLFQKLTGWNCPGCGNTRAVLAIFKLDFAAALHFNYCFPLEIGYIAWIYGNCALRCLKTGKFIYRTPAAWIDWLFLVCLLLWWILRNIWKL